MSWEQQIATTKPGKLRALVMLARAQERGSKAKAHSDIVDAITESKAGSHTTAESLCELYGQARSLEGYRTTAEYFAVDMKNLEAWETYHS